MLSKIFHKPCFKNSVIFLLSFCLVFFFCTGTGWTDPKQFVAEAESDLNKKKYSETEILVKFKENAFVKGNFTSKIKKFNQSYSSGLSAVFNEKLAKNKKNFRKNGLDRIFKIKLKLKQEVEELVKIYEKSDLVEYAEPNYIGRVFAAPNDTNFNLQWGLHNTGQTGGTPDADVDAPEAWDIQTGDSSMSVAVLDTGVDWDHLDLDSDIWTNAGDIWVDPGDPGSGNSVDDDVNGFIDDYKGWDFVNVDDGVLLGLCQDTGDDCLTRDNNPIDFNGHGTHCAGIAAAVTNNNQGVAGMGRDVKIMQVRMAFNTALGGYYETDDAVAAIQYAIDMGADVITASWGTVFEIAGEEPATLRTAVNNTRDNDVIFVAAAGNYPPFGYWEYSTYPAIYNGVISVAATNHDDIRAGFSNYASWIDIAAPGEDIYSTTFNAAVGNSTYDYGSGTSMATPLVAGVAALLKSNSPTLSRVRLENYTKSRIDNIGNQNPTLSHKLGLGRANAEKVLNHSQIHPSGSIITAISTSHVYYLDGGTKRHIMNPSVFIAQFNWGDIIWVSTSELNSYPEAPYFRYPDGTLISNGGKAYVVEYETKRWITSGAVFDGLGYSWGNVIPVSDSVANDFARGANLDSTGYHPSGTIITAPGDPKVYILDNGQKRWIQNEGIFNRNYSWNHLIWVSAAEKDGYSNSDDIGRYDGSLIVNNNKVYAIEYGEKRWIINPATFTALGYKWGNISVVDDTEAAIYPNGPDLTIS